MEPTHFAEQMERSMRKLCKLKPNQPLCVSTDTKMQDLGLDSLDIVEWTFDLEKNFQFKEPIDLVEFYELPTYGAVIRYVYDRSAMQ